MTTRLPHPLHRRPRRAGPVASALIACGVFGAALANAQQPQGGSSVQGVPNAVQGFSQNRDKPISIDAASLEVRDRDKAATFKGDVKVVQGDTTMRCKVLVVFYEGGGSSTGASASATPAPSASKSTMTSATPGPTGSSSIRRLEAKGGVIVTQKEQTVTGDTGDFDMKSNTVTMNGNVVLTKGDNILKGDKLIVDMTTGVSRVEMKPGGRVSGLFKSNNKNDAASNGPPSLLPGSAPATTPSKPHTGSPGKPLDLNDMTDSGRR